MGLPARPGRGDARPGQPHRRPRPTGGCGDYSLGMRQRLGIAAALLGDPSVLILDEPANGLDPAGIRWMRDLLRDYADRGGTVLLSSHLLARDRGHRRRHRDDRAGADRLPGHQGRAPRGRRHRRPRRGHRGPAARPERGRLTSTVSEDGSLHTDADPAAGRARGVRRRRRAHRAPHTPTAPGSRRCSSSSPPTPNEKEDSGMTATTIDQVAGPVGVPSSRTSRSAGSSASSCARCSTPAPASG